MSAQQGKYGATRYGFENAEAFMLMKYQSKDGSVTEFLWNSRDGVTPFGIMAQEGLDATEKQNIELFHVDWHMDQFAPNHVPQAGDRIFVDLTPERHAEYIRRRVEAWWDHPEYPMRNRWESKDTAITELLREESKQQGQPDIITVDADWIRKRLLAVERSNRYALNERMKQQAYDIGPETESRVERKERLLATQLAEARKQLSHGNLTEDESALLAEFRVWKRSAKAIGGVFHFRVGGSR